MLTLSSGDRWLIDCGRQAPDQLHDAGITWHDLAGQIITHVHGDHVFGLEDFAFGRFYESRGDVASIVSGSTIVATAEPFTEPLRDTVTG